MKKRVLMLIALLSTAVLVAEDRMGEDKAVPFAETWSYLVQGYEGEFDPSRPISDLCYFSADVNEYGEIASIPDRAKIPAGFKGRVHLVTTCESRSLSHFVVDPKYKVTKRIVKTLTQAARDYDGLQIDWELVPARDAANYQRFLKALRKSLPKGKMLTICVHARTGPRENDVEDYATLSPLVDRIFIMAYDEHWGGSAPGAVSSMDWLSRVTDWGTASIPRDKLIVGLPFYGRSWATPNLSKAWYHSGITRTAREYGAEAVRGQDGLPHISFSATVRVEGWYDDAASLRERCLMLKGKGVSNVGFWRLGQEDPAFWNLITLEDN